VTPIERDLAGLAGAEQVLSGTTAAYLADATESRGGCVPAGGVVLCTERLARVRSFDPLLWRTEVEAGCAPATSTGGRGRTGSSSRPTRARPSSRTSAATSPPMPAGARVQVRRDRSLGHGPGPSSRPASSCAREPVRKDVAGYDVRGLLVGSEGTLGVVTSVWLRLLLAPEATLPVVAFYPNAEAGCAAIEAVVGSGIVSAALERAEQAAGELFALARRLGGTVSGEHGLGTLRRGQAGWPEPVATVQGAIKAAFDPRGIMNPGKKSNSRSAGRRLPGSRASCSDTVGRMPSTGSRCAGYRAGRW
jgi:hypothetical protein